MKNIYLFESQSENLVNLEHEVDRYLEAGEIVKPEYEHLKSQIDRAIEKAAEEISRKHSWGKGAELHATGDEALLQLSYGVPLRATEVLSLKNKLAKVKLKDHGLYKDSLAFYEKYKALAEKLKELKTKVVTTTKKREEKKANDAKILQQKFSDSSSLVKVLKKHLEEYVDRAGEMTADQFEGWIAELKKHDWDLDKIAPRPKTTASREDYRSAQHKRNFFQSISDQDESGRDNSKRKFSAKKKEAFIEQSRAAARASYLAWVAKMINKIGKSVESAKMVGNPWSGSTLKVVTHDGETQTWLTKMILNKSKYDKLFNQFPSRREK